MQVFAAIEHLLCVHQCHSHACWIPSASTHISIFLEKYITNRALIFNTSCCQETPEYLLTMWLTVVPDAGSIVHVNCQNVELISQTCTYSYWGCSGDVVCKPQMCAVGRVQPSEWFQLAWNVKTVMPSCFGWTPQVGDQLLKSFKKIPLLSGNIKATL